MEKELKWPDDFINKVICGDCLEVMRQIPHTVRLCVITDPIWPNAINLFDCDDPKKLLHNGLSMLKNRIKRIVIHLGLDSDPRFLTAVPKNLPFIRSFALRYAVPSYKGRILYDRDVAYLFGEPPKSRKGNHLLAGGGVY